MKSSGEMKNGSKVLKTEEYVLGKGNTFSYKNTDRKRKKKSRDFCNSVSNLNFASKNVHISPQMYSNQTNLYY